jgi:hypothetical protein
MSSQHESWASKRGNMPWLFGSLQRCFENGYHGREYTLMKPCKGEGERGRTVRKILLIYAEPSEESKITITYN